MVKTMAKTNAQTAAVLDELLGPELVPPIPLRLLPLRWVRYSIRVPTTPRRVDCGRCGFPFPAAGPTGFADEVPICDVCMLDEAEELGMVLALVAVARAFAVASFDSADEYWRALAEIGAFARLYERVAARSGPVRLVRRGPWYPHS